MKWTCLLLLLLLSLLFSRLSSPSSLSCKAISKHWQQSNLPFNPARGCPRGLHIPRKSCPPFSIPSFLRLQSISSLGEATTTPGLNPPLPSPIHEHGTHLLRPDTSSSPWAGGRRPWAQPAPVRACRAAGACAASSRISSCPRFV